MGANKRNIYEVNNIHPTAVIYPNVIMGEGNTIEAGVVIGAPGAIRGQDIYEGFIVIGNNNHFYPNSVVASPAKDKTEIGDDNLIMSLCNIGHNTEIGSNIELGAGTIIPGHCKILDNVRIKSHCTFKTRITIGKGVIVGQGTNVTKDLLEPGLYYGNPVKFIRKKYYNN